MNDPLESVEQKVMAIFAEMAPHRALRLDGSQSPSEARNAFTAALSTVYSTEIAKEVAFHLTDWNWDAAFIVAVHLFPERFTHEELVAGADLLLVHAPNHLAAAATLTHHPIQDIFGVGVLKNSTDHE